MGFVRTVRWVATIPLPAGESRQGEAARVWAALGARWSPAGVRLPGTGRSRSENETKLIGPGTLVCQRTSGDLKECRPRGNDSSGPLLDETTNRTDCCG